mmetsp:Transcript_20362/g.30826  ORF Transcript_20362/g.30826 Transcript_20362/m.30826 type:complete len:85 (+) Transcript_20362:188-442(+)
MCHQTVETRRGTGRGGERWGRLRQETQRFREFVCRGDAQDWESSRRGDMGAMKVENNRRLQAESASVQGSLTKLASGGVLTSAI